MRGFWWRRRPPSTSSVQAAPPPVVVVAAMDCAEAQDAVLEVLGVVLLGEPDRVEESVIRAVKAPSGQTVTFLVLLLVEQLRRDGYEAAVARLQELALAAKRKREPTS